MLISIGYAMDAEVESVRIGVQVERELGELRQVVLCCELRRYLARCDGCRTTKVPAKYQAVCGASRNCDPIK